VLNWMALIPNAYIGVHARLRVSEMDARIQGHLNGVIFTSQTIWLTQHLGLTRRR
jgi:hypothetical protein